MSSQIRGGTIDIGDRSIQQARKTSKTTPLITHTAKHHVRLFILNNTEQHSNAVMARCLNRSCTKPQCQSNTLRQKIPEKKSDRPYKIGAHHQRKSKPLHFLSHQPQVSQMYRCERWSSRNFAAAASKDSPRAKCKASAKASKTWAGIGCDRPHT